jgi:hypothetical protein
VVKLNRYLFLILSLTGWVILLIFITIAVFNGGIFLHFNLYNEMFLEFFLFWGIFIYLIITIVRERNADV